MKALTDAGLLPRETHGTWAHRAIVPEAPAVVAVLTPGLYRAGR